MRGRILLLFFRCFRLLFFFIQCVPFGSFFLFFFLRDLMGFIMLMLTPKMLDTQISSSSFAFQIDFLPKWATRSATHHQNVRTKKPNRKRPQSSRYFATVRMTLLKFCSAKSPSFPANSY